MRIDRLLGILTVLLRQKKVTAPQLAEKFEVSRRTISRDLEDLALAGIPVVTAQGYDGGISIAEGYRIDKTVFTAAELEAVLTGLQGLESVSEGAGLKRLKEKLLPDSAAVISEGTVRIDLSSHYKTSLAPKIERLRQAAAERRLVNFCYSCGSGNSERTVEPCFVLFRWSAWYLFGYCLKREGYRLFKLNRLTELAVEKTQFAQRTIPEEELDFDRFFADGISFSGLFDPAAEYRLIDEYGADSYTATERGLFLEISFATFEALRQWVLSFGEAVTVLTPPGLREELARTAKKMLKKYEEHDS